MVKLKKINPIARAFAYLRKRTQVVPPKKVRVHIIERERKR